MKIRFAWLVCASAMAWFAVASSVAIAAPAAGDVAALRGGHKPASPAGAPGKARVKLSAEELDRIITWIDLNVPYYPSHVTYYVYDDRLNGGH